jgi:ribosomal protein L16/L10AE
LVAEQKAYLSNFQQNAIKNHLKKHAKKNFQIFFRIFPKIPITKKPNEVRLGCGKGNVKY